MIERTDEGFWVISEDQDHAAGFVRTGKRLDFDTVFVDAVRQYIQPGQIALDIGANIGSHSYAYQGLGATVFSFEPNPEPFTCLINNCPGVTALNVALTDSEGEMEQWVPLPDTGSAFLRTIGSSTEDPYTPLKWVIRVTTRTLDSVYRQYQHLFDEKRVCYMKIDTEGSEPLVIRGAPLTIQIFRPVIVVEVCYNTLWRFGFNADDILRPLILAGYRISDLPIPQPHRHDEHYAFNALCLP